MKKLILIVLLITSFGYGQTNKVKKTVSSELKGYRNFSASAYCLTGRTATGRKAGTGIVAVDPRIIPLGSKIEIFGMGTYIASDTGGAIKGNRIDIWMPCKSAIIFGRRAVKIKII